MGQFQTGIRFGFLLYTANFLRIDVMKKGLLNLDAAFHWTNRLGTGGWNRSGRPL